MAGGGGMQGSGEGAAGHPSPAAAPLDCPEALLAWGPRPQDALCRASVPLGPPPEQPRRGRPRLLACHDMAGGYHEDRWAQGCTLAPGAPPPYLLRRWHAVDDFVYFSHRLVAIPPPGWINAAHTHGVRVLGTLITEWDAGAAACRRLFGTAADAEAAAERLAAIAAFFGFEGWLINIENAVDPGHIPHLLAFLRSLTARMAAAAPGRGAVIWYDAVTVQGKLKWQNALTPHNRPFLDACSALWCNYTWKAGMPAAVRAAAGDRACDVFMGVDCYGRGTFGGGGFRCDTALWAARRQGLPVALFATGWPFEGDCGAGAPACWQARDALFWGAIERAWLGGAGGGLGGAGDCCSGDNGGTAGSDDGAAAGAAGSQSRAEPAAAAAGGGAVLRRLPVHSDFCAGWGLHGMWRRGRRLSAAPWYNLSLQVLQPTLAVHVAGSSSSGSGSPTHGGGGAVHALPCSERAYSRGGSVRISGSLLPGQLATVELFPAAAPLPPSGAWVRLAASTAAAGDARLALRLAPAGAGPAAFPLVTTTVELLLPPPHGALPPPAGSALPWTAGGKVAVAQPASDEQADAAAADGEPADGPAGAWAAWECRLGPELLAPLVQQLTDGSGGGGGGCDGLLLAGVDLLVRGGGCGTSPGSSPGSSGSSDRALWAFDVHLGEICVQAASPEAGPPPPPGSVLGLRCSGVQVGAAGAVEADSKPAAAASSGEASTRRRLAAQLAWDPPPGGARCCHVWCWFEGSGGRRLAPPAWLGMACAPGWWAAGVPVPHGAAVAAFAAQPEGWDGAVQPLQQAASVRVALAAGGAHE